MFAHQHHDIDCSKAAKFKPGQTVVVKDFYALEEPAQSLDFRVVRLTPDNVFFIDADGKELRLKRRRAHRWEWCYLAPATLLTPVPTQ